MYEKVLLEKKDWLRIKLKISELKRQFIRYEKAISYGLKMIDQTIEQLEKLREDLQNAELDGWFSCWDCKHPNAGQ